MVKGYRFSGALFLLAIAAAASGCGGEAAIERTEAEATSAQDPAVAKVRRLFDSAGRSSVAALGSKSPTGMKTTWNNCIERSAQRNATLTSTVTYVFAGSGEDVVNTGSGWGKVFIPDATEGTNSGSPEAIGYPSSVATTPHVTLEVARIARNGDLVIERILKPATHDTAPSLDAAFTTEYERAIYADRRAFATAYIHCPLADRTLEGGGTTNLMYFDDCKDASFTMARWSDGQPSRRGMNACIDNGTFDLDDRPASIHVEVEFAPGEGARIVIGGLWVSIEDAEVRIEKPRLSDSAPNVLSAVPLPPGATTLRIDASSSGLAAFAGGTPVGTAVTEESFARVSLARQRGALSRIKIW